MRTLLLSASTGNGHMSAAFAVERELLAMGHEARTVDVLDYTAPGFRRWYRGGYETLVRRMPAVWGLLYRASDRPRFAYRFQTGLDLRFVEKVRAVVAAERPDWVVCTHSLPQPSLERWRSEVGYRVGVVVTDLYPQLMWLRGAPDRYFVPVEWTRDKLLARNPALGDKVEVTGMPIDARFGDRPERGEAKRALGLDPSRPVVLLTVGGIGGGPMATAVHAVASVGRGAQAVAVCGRNEAARLAVQRAVQSRPGFLVRGHVPIDEMIGLVHAADVMVAKPGGLTTFEALAAGVPFLVYRPFLIPGQEEGNGDFLQEKGVGEWVEGPADLARRLAALLDDPDRLAAMGSAALTYARPDAARQIAESLARLSGPAVVRG